MCIYFIYTYSIYPSSSNSHHQDGGIGLPTLGFGWSAVGDSLPSVETVCSESKIYYTPTGESDMQTCHSLKQNKILTTVTCSFTLFDCILKLCVKHYFESVIPAMFRRKAAINFRILHPAYWTLELSFGMFFGRILLPVHSWESFGRTAQRHHFAGTQCSGEGRPVGLVSGYHKKQGSGSWSCTLFPLHCKYV